MKLKYVLLALLLSIRLFGQSQSLSLGNKLPLVTIHRVINYPVSEIQLSAFKEKLLILDFWATWCSSCLYTFPRLDSLQRNLDGRLQVLLVNSKTSRDDAKKLDAFFKKHSDASNLPSIVGDTVLDKLFPHQSLPHFVWIWKGKLIAVTGSDEVVSAKILAVLDKRPVLFKMKKDIMGAEAEELLRSDDSVLCKSVIRKKIEGLISSTGITKDAAGLVSRVYYVNVPLLRLYRDAFRVTTDKITLDLRDPSGLGSYCYELLMPGVTEDSLYGWMRQDLLRFFPYRVEWDPEQRLLITDH